MGLVEPGDEVIILEPAYISYLQLARGTRQGGASPRERGKRLAAGSGRTRAAVTPKTKLLVLNTPAIPPVWFIPERCFSRLPPWHRNKTFGSLDEVYEKLIYDGAQHVSIASLDGMKERTITINGFSKAFAMTGWRMGYLAADARLILPMLKVHQYAVASSNIIAQSAAITALQAGESCVEKCGGNTPADGSFAGCLAQIPKSRVWRRPVHFTYIPIFPAPGCPARNLPTSS